MLTIRLQRVGRKNDPSFRVILVESKRAAKTGNYQEMLGSYDPRTNRVELKADRITYWMSVGATVSDTVHNLLVSQKIIDAKKINVLPRKSPPKKEGEEVAAAPAAAAENVPAAEEAAAPEASADEAVSNDVAAETPAQ
jgi:small subunit ribosomal protein S16